MFDVDSIIIFGTPWLAVVVAVMGIVRHFSPGFYEKHGRVTKAVSMVAGLVFASYLPSIMVFAPWVENVLPVVFSSILLFVSVMQFENVERKLSASVSRFVLGNKK